MKAGHTLELLVESVASDGCGTARDGDHEIRVAGAAPGDRVVAVVEHVSRHESVAWARLQALTARGPGYAEPPCPHAAPVRGRCGGCPVQHLSAEVELTTKARHAAAELAGLWALTAVEPAPARFGYRNHATFVAQRQPRGGVRLGSYAPRSHEVARMDGCLTLVPPLQELAEALARTFTKCGAPVHPEPDGLRYAGVRANRAGEALVELIVTRRASGLGELAAALLELPGVSGVAASENPSTGNALRIAPAQHLAGRKTLAETYGPVQVELAADGFLQLNTAVAERMYARAADLAGPARVLWDLYCGVGALGLRVAAAHRPERLAGAEVHPASLPHAAAAAARLEIPAEYACADLTRGVPASWPSPDVILANPPRRGLDPAVLEVLARTTARRLVYMSCSPRTFARDARALLAHGWRLGHLEAHDMLPCTLHVELLALLER